MRALVIHPGAVGDVLLALPALAHLETLGETLSRPVHRVLAVGPRLAGLLEETPWAEETVELDRLPLSRLFETDPDPHTLAPRAAIPPIAPRMQ